MKTRTLLLVLFTLAVFAVAAPAAVAQSDNPGAIPFESLVVMRGDFHVPADKNSPGSLVTQIQFSLAVSGGSVSPSTDQFLFVFEPAQPASLPAVLPAIVVSLPGRCLELHKSGGWTMGDGSVRDCGFQLYHLFPNQSKTDLTPFVTDVGVRLVEVVAIKSWEMKLQVDFSGVDPAGIVGPTMLFATVGNHTGMTNLSTSIEFFTQKVRGL
ncbi:MAG: hypothetical protein ACRD5G_05350 [Candidatus Acidiferrales bacterium]